MKVIILLFFIFLSAGVIKSQDETSLEGKKWVLSGLSESISIDNKKLNTPFIVFEKEGKLYGNTSCNNLMGTYELSGKNKIKITAASTRKMCEDMTIENALNNGLGKANNYSIAGNKLTLKNGKKMLAEFEGRFLETTLENTTWNLTELVGKPAGKNSMNDSYYTLLFNEDKKVNGKICNVLLGNYEKLDNNGLKIDMQVSTMMSCPELETEMLFKEALSLVSGYEIKENKELILKNGRVILARFILGENK